jgi:hypothetical protein
MQTDISSRMEKLWALADIAQRQGQVSFDNDDTGAYDRRLTLCGLVFDFLEGRLVRLKGPSFEIRIADSVVPSTCRESGNVVVFPGLPPILRFVQGTEVDFDLLHSQFSNLHQVFSGSQKVAA